MRTRERISKSDALNFLLTHIVVERGHTIELNQLTLFKLTSVAQRAADAINESDDIIPHEVIESLANDYLEGQ